MDLRRNITDTSQKIFHLDQYRSHGFEVGDEFSDVTVKTGTTSIRCHKRVLEIMSPYFKGKFTTLLKDNNTDVVDLGGIYKESFPSFIEMAYSNQLRVDVNNVQQVTLAADFLLMDKLKLFCEDFLIEQLHATNVFGFRNFSQKFGLFRLLVTADKLIASNFA